MVGCYLYDLTWSYYMIGNLFHAILGYMRRSVGLCGMIGVVNSSKGS